jgi:hypothetical protein
MKCDSYQSKLLKCRTYAEAAPILETMNLGPSAHTLARFAYAYPPEQQHQKENLIADIIQEARIKEEEEKKTRMEEEEKTTEEEEEEEKKTREYEGGKGTISSKPGAQNPALDRLDKSTITGEKPDTGFPSPENQMREALRKQNIPESVISKVLKEMDSTTASQRLVIETVIAEINRANSPIITELKKHREALISLDKKFKEVSTKTVSMPVDVRSPPGVQRVRETNSMSLNSVFDVKRRPSLEDTRNEIKELDDAMSNGLIKRTEPYA